MSDQARKILNCRAKLILESRNYSGIIENLTGNDIYMRAVPVRPLRDFLPGETVKVRFRTVDGEPVTVEGKVKWSYRTPPHGLTNSLGVEITSPSVVYSKLPEAL